jgi:hypothetical protein
MKNEEKEKLLKLIIKSIPKNKIINAEADERRAEAMRQVYVKEMTRLLSPKENTKSSICR